MNRLRTRGGLGRALLLLAILVLGFFVVAEQRREARLRAALAQFQSRHHARIYEVLSSSIPWVGGASAVPLKWGGRDSLSAVVGQLSLLTGRLAGRRLSLTVEIDPVGLEEAGQSLRSMVKLPPAPSGEIALDEVLQQILKPNNLAWQVKDGTLTITSQKALDRLNERILKRLEQPMILTWSERDSLEDVVERVRASTLGQSFPAGLPILVRDHGYESRAEALLPDPARKELPIAEQLRLILGPMGLRYQVQNGAVVVLAEDAADDAE